MIRDAEAHADEAHRLRELADARNVAEQLAYQTDRTLKEHRDKLDEADASTIEGRVMELRAVSSGGRERNPQQGGRAQEASRKPGEAVYAPANAQAQASPTGNGAPTSDDEVVEEGEYEVIDEEEAKTS